MCVCEDAIAEYCEETDWSLYELIQSAGAFTCQESWTAMPVVTGSVESAFSISFNLLF